MFLAGDASLQLVWQESIADSGKPPQVCRLVCPLLPGSTSRLSGFSFLSVSAGCHTRRLQQPPARAEKEKAATES